MILIIILLLLLLFIICFKYNLDNFKNNEKYPIYNLYTNIDHYRIGDLLKGYGNSPMIGNDKNLSLENGILKMHPNTFAEKYIKNKKMSNLSPIKLLNNIIPSTSKNNICILHLRVGDILDDKHYNNSKDKLLKKFNDNIPADHENYSTKLLPNWYIKSKKYYIDKINKLKLNNINKVIIIAGSHINIGKYDLSSYFINLIKYLFEDNNFNVELRLAKHPDADIKLVKNSKYFISSNGSYSDLLKEICKLNNNIIL